jgi:lipopolysaccharide/colanic/teichoic acid biosynthesis glycosyltransferase
MPLLNTIKKNMPFSNFKNKRLQSCLYDTDEFSAVLKRERTRVDRNGYIFSLVVFDIGKEHQKSIILRNIIRLMVRRLRSSDEIGWLDERHIGVLLINTPMEGARIFADAILDMVTPESALNYEIYIYPERKKNINDVDDKRQVDHNGQNSLQKYPNSILAMQPLLVRKMPAWKRTFDIIGSLSGLILLSPFFLLTALFIKMISPGPIFFKQKRIGYGGRPFTVWKFRSMNVNADNTHHKKYLAELINDDTYGENTSKPMLKLDDDPQIIPLGNILRKSGLDELPQLINVLLGNMSLVGPRPPILYEVEEYLCWHNGRLDTVPGMTGLWQVSGKNRLSFKEMVRLDIQYSKNLSLFQDIKILLKTPFAIIEQITDRMHQPKTEPKGVEQNV